MPEVVPQQEHTSLSAGQPDEADPRPSPTSRQAPAASVTAATPVGGRHRRMRLDVTSEQLAGGGHRQAQPGRGRAEDLRGSDDNVLVGTIRKYVIYSRVAKVRISYLSKPRKLGCTIVVFV